mmetsp:Transcript_34874/g.109535  ORF Transcript_34874/g.109535 Transcript_34874/m.109535 type:complete len:145 (-) Transcript_34874:170-604(-)
MHPSLLVRGALGAGAGLGLGSGLKRMRPGSMRAAAAAADAAATRGFAAHQRANKSAWAHGPTRRLWIAGGVILVLGTYMKVVCWNLVSGYTMSKGARDQEICEAAEAQARANAAKYYDKGKLKAMLAEYNTDLAAASAKGKHTG